MSSDYIPRLRDELLRAGASRQRRWRPAPTLRPLAVAAAVAVVVAAAAVIALPIGTDERAVQPATHTVGITYRVEPPGAADRTAEVMRARLAGAGIRGARVSVANASLTITAPASARPDVAALAQPGQLAIYDWERSVLGPRGEPAPLDASVTGDPDAGHAAALTKAEAVARAAAVPGAHAAAAPGGRWFVLGGDAALTGADIDSAHPAVDEATREPVVRIELDARGRRAFTDLTRELARRGSDKALPGDGVEAFQHLAIVIDDRILAVPYIDFRQAPDGINGALGVEIAGGLTRQTARDTASILDTGPLPAALR